MIQRTVLPVALFAVLAACGGYDSSSNSYNPTGLGASTYPLIGTVRDASDNAPLQGATVEVLDGPHAGTSATTAADGTYSIPGLSGGMTVRASLAGYQAQSQPVTITGSSVTLDFSLSPS